MFDEEFMKRARASMDAAREKRLQKDRDRPMPVRSASLLPFPPLPGTDESQPPFTRSFPVEILTKIIRDVDYSTKPTCFRVSKQFFHIAGKIFYEDLVIDEENDPESLMMGAEIVDPGVKGKKEEVAKTEDDQTPPTPKTNFKRQLLKYVRSIVIRPHHCPTDRVARANLTKAARMMTGLQQAILSPEADFMSTSPLCQKDTCPIVSGLKPQAITISNLQVDGLDDGPLELFTTALKKAQHATLIIPPTAFYIGNRGGILDNVSGRPEDLSYPTRHCKSVRLILAISEDDFMMHDNHGPIDLASSVAIQEFLASFINLNDSEIDIYIFNDFNGTLDLAKFREELAPRVNKHYEDSVKYLTEQKRLEPKHTDWSADYQVFGLEDYFAIPELHYELDDFWMQNWDFELLDRQRAKFEARKKIRDDMLAELEAVSCHKHLLRM